MIVLDASVVAKCYIAEEDSEKAEHVIYSTSHNFAGPELLRIEVASAICRRARAKVIAPEEAIQRCTHWDAYLAEEAITLIPDARLLPEAVRLAARLGHPLQDCLYLAAALQYKTYLLTADTRLFERANQESLPVQLLMNYGIS